SASRTDRTTGLTAQRTAVAWFAQERSRPRHRLRETFHRTTTKGRHMYATDTTKFNTSEYFAERDGCLLLQRLSRDAQEFYGKALWYEFGRQDAGDRRLKRRLTGHYLTDDFAFADYVAFQVERESRGDLTYLPSITNMHDQFLAFCGLLVALRDAVYRSCQVNGGPSR